MNKSYRSVYNEALGAWVAVSETGARKGKKSRSDNVVTVAAAMLGVAAAMAPQWARAATTTTASPTPYYSVNDGTVQTGDNATGTDSLAIGVGSSAAGGNSLAEGYTDVVSSTDSLAEGYDDTVSDGVGSGAIGGENVVSGNGSYAIGNSDSVANDNTFVIGNNVTSTQANSVVLGNNSTDRAPDDVVTTGTLAGTAYSYAGEATASNGVVSVGASGAERQIINVAAGLLSATSTDAVNGSQLYATDESLAALYDEVNNLDSGSNASVSSAVVSVTSGDTNGSATGTNSLALGANSIASGANSAALGNGTVASGDGSSAVGTGATASGTNSTALGNGATATGTNSVALGAGSTATANNTVSVGSPTNLRTISNVAPGVNGTDAVNVNQLNSTVQNISQSLTNNFNSSLNKVAENAYAGVASAMAMPDLTPMQPGHILVALGGAEFHGQSASGLGVTYRSDNGRWLLNGAASYDSEGDAGVRVQVGYEF